MKDSLPRTIFVATAICLVCSVLVSTLAVQLKPVQIRNKELDKKRNILVAAGLVKAKEHVSSSQIDQLYRENIRPKVIDLRTGEVDTQTDWTAVDERKAVGLDEESEKIDPKQDLAGIKRRPNLSVIYERYEGDELKNIVFPVYGKGLWSTMYGFLTLEPDYRSVSGITFYEHGETPGLGGEIENPNWQKLWVDKKVYAAGERTPILEVVRNGMVDPEKADSQIDGIAGSTLTCRGVANSVRYWLGENGFSPYIEKQLAERQEP